MKSDLARIGISASLIWGGMTQLVSADASAPEEQRGALGEIVVVRVDAGQTSYVQGSDPLRYYEVSNGSKLVSMGATLGQITAEHSTIILEPGSVIKHYLRLYHGMLEMSDSSAEDTIILDQVQEASIKNITALSGLGLSVIVSTVSVEDSSLTGTKSKGSGWGIGVFGGDAHVQNSDVTGEMNAAYMTHTFTLEGGRYLEGRLEVDHSVLESLEGATIKVEGRQELTHLADIEINNDSIMLSGNGNLLETLHRSTTNFTVDDSSLSGNLLADDTSTLNVILQNRASLTGDIINGNTLAVKSGGNWQMVGDNAIKSLSLDGGSVSFADEGFHTLSLNELSGDGSFAMRVDLDKGVGDLIDINGQASGQFGLQVRNTGLEVVSSDMEPLKVVHTEGGDAQFSLLGGRVDLGAFSYQLKQQGNDWFIVGEDRVISPSTQSALALFNAAPTVWMSELSTLRTRMGEIRGTGQGGSWMRAYGSRLNATTGDGVDYRQQISGLSLGADTPVEISSGQLLFGVLGGYSKSDLDLSRGTSGKVDSYYAGAYGTWLSDDGYYLDGVLKINRFRNKAKVAMSDASQAKGDYSNTAVGGWVEFGRHIKLADDYFLEPFAQLSSVVVQGQDYRMDNGLTAKNDHTHSLLGKVGTSAGRSIALKDGGVVQPYVRVAVAQEFSRSNEVSINDTKFDNSLFGSRAELGAGVSVSLSERLQVHADFDYMKGKHIEQPWGANVGLRLAF
ncbi:Outer membrane autotransporter barrel [Pseudomonas viridiflava]|uniref:Outer membrane autotransporter barrel n=1 Tax=Pseudomonas viridiflava TaxID=33069 RepID=A0A3M5P5N6_PSEVI|nr:Outer membrane autotransporter barrel [Pseudomonas viridiflava]